MDDTNEVAVEGGQEDRSAFATMLARAVERVGLSLRLQESPADIADKIMNALDTIANEDEAAAV